MENHSAVLAHNEAQLRRLDLADREQVQDDFFSQPALAFSFD
jgi:hypothetical protein